MFERGHPLKSEFGVICNTILGPEENFRPCQVHKFSIIYTQKVCIESGRILGMYVALAGWGPRAAQDPVDSRSNPTGHQNTHTSITSDFARLFSRISCASNNEEMNMARLPCKKTDSADNSTEFGSCHRNTWL